MKPEVALCQNPSYTPRNAHPLWGVVQAHLAMLGLTAFFHDAPVVSLVAFSMALVLPPCWDFKRPFGGLVENKKGC